jgi:hypothetical protein
MLGKGSKILGNSDLDKFKGDRKNIQEESDLREFGAIGL